MRRDYRGGDGLGVAGMQGYPTPMTLHTPTSGTILHQVRFWLKRPGHAEDRAKLIVGLRTLAAVPQVRALHIGTPADTEARDVVDASWDVSELMVFDTVADQKAYQDHPLHQAFVAACEPLWARVEVYDSLTV